MEKETPKTFKELFANTGIKPTTDENGNIQYNFKATMKQEILPELVNIPMMVSMDGKNWKKRNVIAVTNGTYVTSNNIKTDADTDEEFRSIDYWRFAKPI